MTKYYIHNETDEQSNGGFLKFRRCETATICIDHSTVCSGTLDPNWDPRTHEKAKQKSVSVINLVMRKRNSWESPPGPLLGHPTRQGQQTVPVIKIVIQKRHSWVSPSGTRIRRHQPRWGPNDGPNNNKRTPSGHPNPAGQALPLFPPLRQKYNLKTDWWGGEVARGTFQFLRCG